MSSYVISGKCCVYSIWLNVIIIDFLFCFHLHHFLSSRIPFASVWSFSFCCRHSRLQQHCQHIQDESKLLCPDFPHFPYHPAVGSWDVAALFPRARGYCHSSKEQTHPESWWDSELHTMVKQFIFVPFPELFCQMYFQIHSYLMSFLLSSFVIVLFLTKYEV